MGPKPKFVRLVAVHALSLVWHLVCSGRALGKEAHVTTGRDLASAFSDVAVDTILVVGDMNMQESDWIGLATPLMLRRNVTVVSGRPTDAPHTWPVLDFGYVGMKVRLGDKVTLAFRHVVFAKARWLSHNMAPGFDLLAPCLPGERGILNFQDSMLLFRIGYPASIASQTMKYATRPGLFPGSQTYIIPSNQDGCTAVHPPGSNLTVVPAADQCWPMRGLLVDVVLHGADMEPGTWAVKPNGYVVRLSNVTYCCSSVFPQRCIDEVGPVGCWTSWLDSQLLKATPPPTATNLTSARTSSDGGGSGKARSGSLGGEQLGIILGCVLGGLAVAAAGAASAVVVVVAARRRRQGLRTSWLHLLRNDHKHCGGELAGDRSERVQRWPLFGKPTSLIAPIGSHKREGVVKMSHELPKIPEEVNSVSIAMPTHTDVEGPSGGDCGHGFITARKVGPDLELSQNELHTSNRGAFTVVSPLTPPRQDVRLDVQPGNEVRLLPRVLGKGGFGKVVEGEYQGQRVAVKVLLEGTLEAWGLAAGTLGMKAMAPEAAAVAGGVAAEGEEGEGVGVEVGAEFGGGAGIAVHGVGVCGGDGRGEVVESQKAGGRDSLSCYEQDMFLRSLWQEVEVLGRCHHPNVVRLLAACMTPPRMCLVMELMDTSLDRLLYGREGDLLPMHVVLDIALDVARALEYLHPTVVHRDLKPANVLIKCTPDSLRLVAKLSDFGLSRLRSTVQATRTPEAGTPEFMAPELFDLQNFIVTHKADVFSFGVLLWTMLTGQRPWHGEGPVAVAVRVSVRAQRPPLETIPRSRRVSKLTHLLEQCWEQDPRRRPAAAEVVKWLLVVREQMALKGKQLSSG